jgi:hypothetical protein
VQENTPQAEPSGAFAVVPVRQSQDTVRMRARVISLASCLFSVLLSGGATHAQDRAELRSPSAFAGVSDPQARSRALFTEAAKVIMNPRCMNCHPASDRPTQGNEMHAHSPPVTRGADGGGVPGSTCSACHMDRNVPIFAGQQTSFQSMPGHARWGLAPVEMAWEGKSMGEICRRSRTRSATAAAVSRCCTSIWRTTISSAGPGNRGPAATPRPAPRSNWASWSGPGSTAAPSVRSALEPQVG